MGLQINKLRASCFPQGSDCLKIVTYFIDLTISVAGYVKRNVGKTGGT